MADTQPQGSSDRLLWIESAGKSDFTPHFVSRDGQAGLDGLDSLLSLSVRAWQFGRGCHTSTRAHGVVLQTANNEGRAREPQKELALRHAEMEPRLDQFGQQDFVTFSKQGAAGAQEVSPRLHPAALANAPAVIHALTQQYNTSLDQVLKDLPLSATRPALSCFSALTADQLAARVKALGGLISKRAAALQTLGISSTAELDSIIQALQQRDPAIAQSYAAAAQRWQSVLSNIQQAAASKSAHPALRPPLRVGEKLPMLPTHPDTPLQPVIAAHRGAVLVLLRHFG